jgi:hypothetical protein
MAIKISGTDVIDNSRNIVNAGIVSCTGGVTLTTVPFFINPQTVASNFTVTGTQNAHSAGPITINSGITVTINTGGYWVVV